MDIEYVLDLGRMVRESYIDIICKEEIEPGYICNNRMYVAKWTAAYGTYVRCPKHGERLLPDTIALKE